MLSEKAPLLHSRLLRFITGLFAVMGLFCVTATGSILYFNYRSNLVRETSQASTHFQRLLSRLQQDLLHNSELLTRLHREAQGPGGDPSSLREMEVLAFKWFHQTGLEVLGTGSRAFWLRRGFQESELRGVMAGAPAILLQRDPGSALRMVAAIPVGASSFSETSLLMAALRMDGAWLRNASELVGSEIVLCDEGGKVLATSLPVREDLPPQLPATGEDGVLIDVGDAPYGMRTFPLEFQGRVVGRYSILTPADSARSLAILISALLCLSLATALGLTYWITLRLLGGATREVSALAEWADAFDQDPAAPPPPCRYNETLLLSRAFGNLVGRLDAAKSSIERRNLGLERDIAAKTEAIVKQNELMDLILSELPLALLLTERSGRLLYANARTLELFGLSPGQALLPAPLDDIVRNQGRQDRTLWEIRHQGRDFKVLAFTLEAPERTLLVLEDLTERHAMEERLSQAQKLESVSRLAGGVAHDFNNALASIMPCVDILREKLQDPKTLSYVDAIEKAALRGADVVRQLLAFSRAGAYNPRKLDLNQTVEGAVKLFRPTAKQTVVEWTPAADLPPMHGDESQIQQMLLNLAINALDALGGQGTIRFETWADRERNLVGVAVSDTGPGVPPDIAKLIFDPFFTTKEPGKGTGLGLSVAYGVVQRHQGAIRLVQKPGEGARFEVEFPMVRDANGDAAKGGPAPRNGDDIVIGG